MASITHTTGRPLGILDLVGRILRALPRRRSGAVDQTRSDAAAVRRLAESQRKGSPSFAADLDAAADRHELNER